MALPWLIGAAVVGIGALIASSSGGDNNDNNNDEEERLRKKEEEAHRKRQKVEQRNSIKEALKTEGENRALGYQQVLSGWVNVEYNSKPAFKGTILQTGKQYQRVISEYFSGTNSLYLLNRNTQENLNKLESYYDVELGMTEDLNEAITTIIDCKQQLEILKSYRNKLDKMKKRLLSEKENKQNA